MNNQLFSQLRSRFPEMIYHSYEIGDGTFKFHFSIGEHHFYPYWEYNYNLLKNYQGNRDFLEYCVFNLGLAELVSYWKCACPPTVIVKCGSLSQKQINWWKKLYLNGLGEFFYRNNIDVDFDNFMSIKASSALSSFDDVEIGEVAGCLIPVGGGKDSVVTLELLSDLRPKNACYIINPRPATIDCARLAGYSSQQITGVRRFIDKELLELNRQGFLNGHTPLSAVIAFSGYIFALLSGKKYVVLSNESSANESYVSGKKINHQYSKSTEFEQDFRDYTAEFLSPQIEYFSLLRPLSEYQIAEIFTNFPKYFKTFQSCNLGSKANIWCGECAKCLYVYILLAAFLDDDVLIDIFGVDMLNNLKFEHTLNALAFEENDKPFECVGTRSEVNLALQKAIFRRRNKMILPILLEKYRAENISAAADLSDFFDQNNFIPACFEIKNRLEKVVKNGSDIIIIDKLRAFFSGKKVLILGFGREGKSTLKLLQNNNIDCEIIIADKSLIVTDDISQFKIYNGDNYLDSLTQSGCDIIMKSPGIALFNDFPPEITQKITSQTDLLLRFCSSKIIGVTGTKGKSTTSSLICHLLNECGKKGVLIGNIGIPPLEMCESFDNETIVVCEMSCHQLEYVKASPSIAVLLNVFEEHLDHYADFAAYKAAKFNIFKYQKSNDALICSENLVDEINKTSPDYSGKIYKAALLGNNDKTSADIYVDSENTSHIFNETVTEPALNTSLPARHNLYNIDISLAAAKICGCDFDAAVKAVSTFKGLPHRLEKIGVIDGVLYINDSICTIPDGVIGAVKAFPTTDTLIIGGMDRGICYDNLVEFLPQSAIKNLICLPDSGYRIAEQLKSKLHNFDILLVKDMSEAVSKAKALTHNICLLSPAAASYGFYKNFEERGNHFRQLVLEK